MRLDAKRTRSLLAHENMVRIADVNGFLVNLQHLNIWFGSSKAFPALGSSFHVTLLSCALRPETY